MRLLKQYKNIVIFLGILILFISLRIPFLSKEYGPEEAAWISAGKGVADTGFFWAYLGEQNEESWAMWKGPLFPWLIGASFYIFGEGEIASRSIPFIFSIGQLLLIFLLSKKIFGDDIGREIGILAGIIVAIHPFAIQNATQIDIDGGLVGFSSLLIIYFFWLILNREELNKHHWIGLFLSSLLAFSIRFDTTLMIFFSVILLALIFRQFKKAVILPLIFSAAISTFMAISFAYYNYFNQSTKIFTPFKNMLAMTQRSLRTKISSTSRLQEILPNIDLGSFNQIANAIFPNVAFLTSVFLWLSVPFVILAIFLLFRIVIEKDFKERGILFLLVPAGIIFSSFSLVAPSFNYPRYIHTSFLLFVIIFSAIALIKYREYFYFWRKKLFIIASLLIILLSFTPAKLLLFEDRVRSNALLIGASFIVAVLLGFLFGFFKNKKAQSFVVINFFIMYLVFAGFSIWHDIKSPYALTAYYGNYGFKKAGQFLNQKARDKDIVVTIDTVGFYYGKAYHNINQYEDREKLKKISREADYLAIYRVPAARLEDLIQNKKLIASFGTIEIFSK